MNTNRVKGFRPQKNADGTEVYCPLDSDETAMANPKQPNEDCVEKDVVERYSGNIDIKN